MTSYANANDATTTTVQTATTTNAPAGNNTATTQQAAATTTSTLDNSLTSSEAAALAHTPAKLLQAAPQQTYAQPIAASAVGTTAAAAAAVAMTIAKPNYVGGLISDDENEREKADSTPENLTKIDDIIEQQQRQQQQQEQQQQQQQQQPHQELATRNSSSPSPSSASGAANVAFSIADHRLLSAAAASAPGSYPAAAAALTYGVDDSTAARNQFCNEKAFSKADSNDNDDSSTATKATTTATATTPKQQSYAFTIDNFDDASDKSAAAIKYQNMLERFQNRHRRGASLSKLEIDASDAVGAFGASGDGAELPATPTTTAAAVGVKNARNARATLDAQQQQQYGSNITGGGGDGDTATTAKVKLRSARDRSTSRLRDAAKRHSWSPRSSTIELSIPSNNNATAIDYKTPSATSAAGQRTAAHQQQQQQQQQKPPTAVRKTLSNNNNNSNSNTKVAPTKGSANLLANRTQFTPRSTAMQMALQKVDFLCPQPPLADYKQLVAGAGGGVDAFGDGDDAYAADGCDDDVSEAGTYTLDGDNYTEEQKDLMNIDSGRQRRAQQQKRQQQHQQQQQQRPKQLDLPTPHNNNTGVGAGGRGAGNRNSNVLEVNYYHDESSTIVESPQTPLAGDVPAADYLLGGHQSAGAYLEQIKTRVLRNMTAAAAAPTTAAAVGREPTETLALEQAEQQQQKQAPPKATEEEDDIGCFTSVTTSGVLAKQSALEPRPKLTRRNGYLSTSQIDSSEFVSNELKLKNAAATDHQKSEYRLNVFTNQKESKFKASATATSTAAAAADAAVLKTAQTKNDWIQEWARNARARSLATESGGVAGQQQQASRTGRAEELMTRSYTCTTSSCGNAATLAGETDDSIFSKQRAAAKQAARYRHASSAEFDFASEAAAAYGATADDMVAAAAAGYKPPKSPSKIPSPLHSLGRARSASRTRAPLQNILSPNGASAAELAEAQDYLQKTADAISCLQQSLSRKNSLKSPPVASPRAHSTRPLYSPDGCSPQHSLESYGNGGGGGCVYQRRSPKQRAVPPAMPQQQQLMTSSFNEQQLQLLTSGQYLMRQMRARKNSYDGGNGGGVNVSPLQRRLEKYASDLGQQQQQQQRQRADEQALSPLRRSSSYSTKIANNSSNNASRPARPQFQNLYTPPALRHNAAAYTLAGTGGSAAQQALKKSASSNNFPYSDYDEHLQYYINDEDELLEDGDAYYSSGEELEMEQRCYAGSGGGGEADKAPSAVVGVGVGAAAGGGGNASAVPLSNTRLNKALLMRIERSKQKVSGGGAKVASAPLSRIAAAGAGVNACPNTPELPRRLIKSAQQQRGGGGGGNTRQSMPRDQSLSRLARQVPNSLASAKRQLLQTAAAPVQAAAARSSSVGGASVQPKYLDISKYKPAQGQNFLRKNDAKSTLVKGGPTDAMKRSPSSSSMGVARNDAGRTSMRSNKSALLPNCMTASGTQLGGGAGGGAAAGRASSAVRRDASVSKQKEAEMAMWKRRSTYDPMKAAADDRRRKEEAKRLATIRAYGEQAVSSESNNVSNVDETESDDPTEEEDQQTAHWTLGTQVYGENEEF